MPVTLPQKRDKDYPAAEFSTEHETIGQTACDLSFDNAAAVHTAEVRADLEQRGCTIGPYDLMIAGHARSKGLIVVTGDLLEFTRVASLPRENWMAN
ncbi:PIN domain-containing protein [Acetobacter fabarum]|uniref:PIN domain-containing protein n=1 Tax=Acetobacter fabarum TaxID=483199 RepID=UPI0039EC6A76